LVKVSIDILSEFRFGYKGFPETATLATFSSTINSLKMAENVSTEEKHIVFDIAYPL